MINYVNNAFDKVLKPCDALQFNTITQSAETERLIIAHRGGDGKAKPKLPALAYMGVLDMPKYKQYYEQCERQGMKPLGSRRAEFMRPTGLFLLDFDHVENPQAVYERVLQVLSVAGIKPADILALVHITPSGDGLRVVMARTKGCTIEHDQLQWGHLIGVPVDGVCKDISRLSFAPMQKEILYMNPSLLFRELPEVGDYPDGSLFQQPLAEASTGAAALPAGKAPQEYDTEYDGVPYSEIVERLEAQLGGRPARGARNSFIFTMACNLRYICNDDADWVASILPTYGEEAQKHKQTIMSAINRPMSRTMPETMARALRISKVAADEANSQLSIANCQLMPPLPDVLPQPIAHLTSRTPARMQAAVAMSVFPPLGAHLCDVRFTYWDGRDYEPTFMNVLVGELSSGKSAVNTPIEYIIADMEARDEVARAKESEWRAKCATISNMKDRPERPQGLAMQVLSADMTNAAFVQRLADAEGKFLYTQMDEIELLNALKTNTQGNTVSAILRLAFDCGKYGQERVASNAVNAKVRVRWNWNASTTVQRVRKFFSKNIADGTLSRLSFATIVKDDQWGFERPKFGQYGQAFADELQPYIDRLCNMHGTLDCPEASAWAENLADELCYYAQEIDDTSYALMSFRAVLMGFFRAMTLYIMNDCQWSQEIADFCAWTVRYDMWCKMRFFEDMLHADLEGERTAVQRGPVSLLSLLPDEFTREQVRELRIAHGKKPDPTSSLKTWKNRGRIVEDAERRVFKKVAVAGCN